MCNLIRELNTTDNCRNIALNIDWGRPRLWINYQYHVWYGIMFYDTYVDWRRVQQDSRGGFNFRCLDWEFSFNFQPETLSMKLSAWKWYIIQVVVKTKPVQTRPHLLRNHRAFCQAENLLDSFVFMTLITGPELVVVVVLVPYLVCQSSLSSSIHCTVVVVAVISPSWFLFTIRTWLVK